MKKHQSILKKSFCLIANNPYLKRGKTQLIRVRGHEDFIAKFKEAGGDENLSSATYTLLYGLIGKRG